MSQVESPLLGPFVGHVTDTRATLWLHAPGLAQGAARLVHVTLHKSSVEAPPSAGGVLELAYERLNVGTVTCEQLEPDTVYFYRLWQDAGHTAAVETPGLTPSDLRFQTLPVGGVGERLDFLLLSCHNPETAKADGAGGFAVWERLPEIMAQNEDVRFALLAGDQVYADDIEARALAEPDERRRQELYLSVYRQYWDNVHYRRVLCRLPAVLMWDDHDITDGWGSREDSFVANDSAEFKPEWRRLFAAARGAFREMQAARNPPPLSSGYERSFDTCFLVGRAAFVVADLRSNRNVRLPRVWLPEQLAAVREWVAANRAEIDTLFFVSPVVFSHGDPGIERHVVSRWASVLRVASWLGFFAGLSSIIHAFNKNIGDLRDDINDAWGSEPNREEADRVLDFLFGLQNPADGGPPINVVILTGDIHTPGHSLLYSSDLAHQRKAIIPHVVATPVAYEPFSWLAEAVYRHLTRVVKIGARGAYTAQVSHHFCYRNAVVVSLRNFGAGESFLKVKYYLEGFPEPQIVLFDLSRGSHRENIHWRELEPKGPLP